MAIFVVIATDDVPDLASQIATQFPSDHIQLAPKQWLISAEKTSKELSDALKITDGAMGRVFVAAISSYYGRHTATVWEWIRVKWEGGPHG